MSDNEPYSSQVQKENIMKLRSVISELPLFCRDFFRGIETTTSILTRLNYAYDLRLFFEYVINSIDEFYTITISNFTLEHLDKINATYIEMFMEYLSYYKRPSSPNIPHQNHECGKARKLSTLRSFFAYFYKHGKITSNTASLVDLPKKHEKPIIRLESDEVAKLLDSIDSGDGLTNTQKRYHQYTRNRDLAMLTLFLGTGIRISECVGLNIEDIDFEINGFKVTRKGGNQVILYFGDEVRKALVQYIQERNKIEAVTGSENALFLSLQKRRISKRAVQNLVKKYSTIIAPLKKISPHKLRSTYGTSLYRETGDIYLVADVLGHKDVNTTKRHYAAIDDEKRRKAAKFVKLRD